MTMTDPTPEPEPTETETVVEPAPPPPLLPPTPTESLAEQVKRESMEMPDSQNPSDVVPNRPMIRPPQVQSEAEAAQSMQATEGGLVPETTTEPVVTETPVVETPAPEATP
jgi:hypothetical protein